MSSQPVVPEISMTNTKAEMFKAYAEIKKLLRLKEAEVLDARKVREEQKRQQTTEAAVVATATDPVARIGELKQVLAAELDRLAARFATEHDAFRALGEEIANRQADLERVFAVETAAVDFAALLEAHKAEREKFAATMDQRRRDLEAEIAAKKAAWQEEAVQHEQKRKREREEFDYDWKRERARKTAELEDQLAALTGTIQARQAEFDEQVAARERELKVRTENVVEREKTLDDLQARVVAFPAELEKSVERAVVETTKRLQSDYDLGRQLLVMDYEGQTHVLESRIESLTNLVAGQVKQIETLTKQQERAYEKVQDIASKAVAGARTIITTGAGERTVNRRAEGDAD
jgi:hypothetical protein